MLEVLYRIYQVATQEERENGDCDSNSIGMFDSISKSKSIELTMDCLICESREHFKDIIKSQYGENIRFAYSKKMQAGEIYCIIIGEHCWNDEKYFNRIEFECDYCHSKVSGYLDSRIKIDGWELSSDLLRQIDKYGNKKFCCYSCKDRYVQQEKAKIMYETDGANLFVTHETFSYNNIAGYIYKITKKSTGEFYIGQTKYVPIFRWGQHLATGRFDIKNILDYQFETIEIVPAGANILERETYYIQKYYKENPSLSLNIMQTQILRKENNQEQENV